MQTDRSDTNFNPPSCRRGIFYFASLLCLLLCGQLGGQPKAEIAEPKHNFGKARKGAVVMMHYELVNKGNQPLLLADAEVECECTKVNWTREPVLPGARTTVTVSFDTRNALGRQDRTVILRSNDPAGPTSLRFKGTVAKKK